MLSESEPLYYCLTSTCSSTIHIFIIPPLTYLRYDLAGARPTHMAPEPARNRFIREVRKGDHTHPRQSIRHEVTRRRSPESSTHAARIKHACGTRQTRMQHRNLRKYGSSDKRTVDSNYVRDLSYGSKLYIGTESQHDTSYNPHNIPAFLRRNPRRNC